MAYHRDHIWAAVVLLMGGGAAVSYGVNRYIQRIRKQARTDFWVGYATCRRDMTGRGAGSLASMNESNVS